MTYRHTFYLLFALIGLIALCGCASVSPSYDHAAEPVQSSETSKAVRVADPWALYLATHNGQSGEVRALLNTGMSVNTKFNGHGTLISVAVSGCGFDGGDREVQYEGRLETVKLLISRNADLTYVDGLDNTLLHDAALHCPGQIVKDLVAAGAPFQGRNKQGYSPLDMALVSANWDVVRVLVDAGARTTAKQIAEIFFELPEDQKLRRLIRRATEAPKKAKGKGK